MSAFKQLLWSADGVEICVYSQEELDAKVAEGYRLTPEPEPVDEVHDGVKQADAQVNDSEVPPADPENEPPTFGAADDDTFGESEQVEDGKPKKKKK